MIRGRIVAPQGACFPRLNIQVVDHRHFNFSYHTVITACLNIEEPRDSNGQSSRITKNLPYPSYPPNTKSFFSRTQSRQLLRGEGDFPRGFRRSQTKSAESTTKRSLSLLSPSSSPPKTRNFWPITPTVKESRRGISSPPISRLDQVESAGSKTEK